jgi:hypothetical protein
MHPPDEQAQANYQKMLVALFMLLVAFFIALTSQTLFDQKRAGQVMQSMQGRFADRDVYSARLAIEDSATRLLIERMQRIKQELGSSAELISETIEAGQGQMIFTFRPELWFDGAKLTQDTTRSLVGAAAAGRDASYLKWLLVMKTDEQAPARLSHWSETMNAKSGLTENQLMIGLSPQNGAENGTRLFILIR